VRRWLLILAILASVVTAAGATTPTPEEIRETTGMAIDYHPGKEPTLVFIHGWTCNRNHWKKQMPRLKGRYEIVTLDMAGHGESAAKKSEWTVSGLADGVVEVIEALDLDRVILIGHSMGGAVALTAAPRAKGRVIGIIGVDTLQDAEFTISGEQVNEVVANFERDYPAAMAGFIDGFFAARPEAAETKVFVQKTMGKVRPEIAVSLLRSYLEKDAPRAFRGAGVPIHCINAAMPYGTEIEINRKYAEFDADLVKNVTHFLMLEKPEEFNPLLEQAIEKLAKENKEESSRMSHPSHIHHAIDYIELAVTDMAEARRFYAAAFGWEFNEYGPEYTGIKKKQGEGEVGGMRLESEVTTGGPLVILYSAELDASFEQVKEAGGRITKEPFSFPGGRRFQFLDPSGNELAVWSEK
jgi:pimeloyl-ACP methyl ester carboxylesterase/predicted enzyme related to lactoylglutathione lyase